MNVTQEPKKRTWVARLEIVTYLMVLAVCAVILTDRVVARSATPAGELSKGDRVEALKELVPDDSDKAFVLVLSPTCKFCKNSLPSFQQLIEARDRQGSRVAISGVVRSPDQIEPEADVLQTAGVRIDTLTSINLADMKIRGVPTTLLIDRDGTVLESWLGEINETRAQELIRHL